MSSRRLLGFVGVLGGVILLGVGVGYLASRNTGGNPQLAMAPTNTTSSSPATSEPAPPRSRPVLNPHPFRPHPHTNAAPGVVLEPISPENPNGMITNWEDKVEEILGGDDPEAQKAKKMLAIFRQLPADGQVEVAQHLSNLVADEDYAQLGKLLTDPKLPEDVLDVLLGDVLNRPNATKLPLLLDIASEPTHPKAGEAKDMLELFLEEDYGTNWAQWRTKLNEWLEKNPD